MPYIDSHAHLNSSEFKDGWKNIVTEAKNAGLSTIINIGSDLSDSEWGIAQANQEPIVFTTIGIHPEALSMEQSINNLRRLMDQSQKVVGIGEIGLDYTLDSAKAPKQLQIDLLLPQLQLASDSNLPVILHVRDQKGSDQCFNDLMSLLRQFTTSNIQGLFHCWTGTPDQAQQSLDIGFSISFSGIVTYKSAGHILQAAAMVPDDKILIETDSPFLIPEPARSRQHPSTNEPKYVILTAEKLADIRQTTLGHIAEVTTANAQKLFRLPPTIDR